MEVYKTLCPHCCEITRFEGDFKTLYCVECGFPITKEKFIQCDGT